MINFPVNHYYIRFPKDCLNITFNKFNKQIVIRLTRSSYIGISLTKNEFLDLINNKEKILENYDKLSKKRK